MENPNPVRLEGELEEICVRRHRARFGAGRTSLNRGTRGVRYMPWCPQPRPRTARQEICSMFRRVPGTCRSWSAITVSPGSAATYAARLDSPLLPLSQLASISRPATCSATAAAAAPCCAFTYRTRRATRRSPSASAEPPAILGSLPSAQTRQVARLKSRSQTASVPGGSSRRSFRILRVAEPQAAWSRRLVHMLSIGSTARRNAPRMGEPEMRRARSPSGSGVISGLGRWLWNGEEQASLGDCDAAGGLEQRLGHRHR